MNYGQEIQKLYDEMDLEIINYYSINPKKVPCDNGCSDCCSQFFEISMVEYLVILREILGWSKNELAQLFAHSKLYMKKMNEEYPSLYNQVISLDKKNAIDESMQYFNKDRFLFYTPCIFVDKERNCMIYKSRPLICRTTGTSYTSRFDLFRVCPHIKGSLLLNRYRVNLRKFIKRILNVDTLDPVKYRDHKLYQTFTYRKRPIAYYIYDTFVDKKSMEFYKNLCTIYFNQTREEIANQQFAQSIKRL